MEETRIHPETGEILRRDIRPIVFSYKGEKIFVDMPGWYPAEGDDGIFTHEDMLVSDQALRILKSRHEITAGADESALGDLSF
ncbi:MAG: hypothetical protein J5809_04430 [Selenomonadaceae bacterium]|nr:hypothetical protein [Selenomonadaceae bacterium]